MGENGEKRRGRPPGDRGRRRKNHRPRGSVPRTPAATRWSLTDAAADTGGTSDGDHLDGMTHLRPLSRASRRMNATVGSTGYRPNRDP